MFAGNIFAQQHLSFKGVPIDGTLKSYTDAMVKAGFHYEGTQDGTALLTGDFAGYKGCTILVLTQKNSDNVCSIAVSFPEHDTWKSLQSNYENLKSMLIKKYGDPIESTENFTTNIYDYDNYFVMEAIREEKFDWHANFETESGIISLTLSEGKQYGTGTVLLLYIDKANSEKVRNAAMDDL